MVIWFAAAFIAFSLISGKRARYMVPLFPPLAITVGALADHLITGGARALRGRARLLLMAPHLLFLAIGSLFLALWGVGTDLARSAGIDDPDTLAAIGRALTGSAGTGFLLVGVGLVVIGGGCAVAAGRGRAGIVTAGLVAAMAVVSLGFDFVLAPQMNEVKSGRNAARRIDELAPPGEGGQVALYPNVYSGLFNLYTGRIGMPVLETPAALNQFLASPEFGLVVLTRKVFDRDAAQLTAPYRVVESDRVGHRTYLYFLPPAAP